MAASLRASKAGLERIERARKQKRWKAQEDAWYQLANTTLPTLKRFRSGKPISADIFAKLCRVVGIDDWESLVETENSPPATPSHPGAAFDGRIWVDRPIETDILLDALRGDRRIVAISGISGIGKTALAERAIDTLADNRRFCYRDLDRDYIEARFSSSGAELLRSLGEEVTLEDQKSDDNLRRHLLETLRDRPLRVQIDSLERLLTEEREGEWSEFADPQWLRLFEDILSVERFQSQIVITAQEIPAGLKTVASRYPARWHAQELRGLDEAQQLALFAKVGIIPPEIKVPLLKGDLGGAPQTPTENPKVPLLKGDLGGSPLDYLKRIGRIYRGHPLVLRVIAEDIKSIRPHPSDFEALEAVIALYWQDQKFETLEAGRPTQLTRLKLQTDVRERIRTSLLRLPKDSLELLRRVSVFRRSVPGRFWLALLPDCAEAALNVLKARSLAEEVWEIGEWYGADGEIPLRQHNLIRNVANEMLRQNSATWRAAERQAAALWLEDYQPATDAPNLEKVRGYLEAFYHYCDAEDWDDASQLFMKPLGDSDNTQLFWLLDSWGYYQDEISLCQRLLGQSTQTIDAVCWNGIGNAYIDLGDYFKTEQAYQKSLAIAKEIGDKKTEGKALQNLGNVSRYLGKFKNAEKYLEEALNIFKMPEIKDKRQECIATGTLGAVYRDSADYSNALRCFENQLTISKEINDLHQEGLSLSNIALIHYDLNHYHESILFYEKALQIHQINDYRNLYARININLSIAYSKNQEYEKALKTCQKGLEISQQINCKELEGFTLIHFGIIYTDWEKYQKAIDYLEKAKLMAEKLGHPLQKGFALAYLGRVLRKCQLYREALDNLRSALALFQEIGNRAYEAEALKDLATLYHQTHQPDRARDYCRQALQLATDLGIPLVADCQALLSEIEGENGDAQEN